MKRSLKFLSLMLSLAICASLTGCKELDELREAQGVWNKGNITVGNYEYIPLPACESFNPDYRYGENTVNVTEAGVPVLLSGFIGTTFQKTEDGIFLLNYSGYSSDAFGCDYTEYYCRSDKYESIAKRISEKDYFDGYCYSYVDYSSEYMDEEWGSVKYRIFSENEAQTLEKLLESVQPTVMPEIADINYEYQVYIERCSDDLLFREGAFELSVSNGRYFLTVTEGENTLFYEIPSEYNEIFEKITAEEIESEKGLEKTFVDADFS